MRSIRRNVWYDGAHKYEKVIINENGEVREILYVDGKKKEDTLPPTETHDEIETEEEVEVPKKEEGKVYVRFFLYDDDPCVAQRVYKDMNDPLLFVPRAGDEFYTTDILTDYGVKYGVGEDEFFRVEKVQISLGEEGVLIDCMSELIPFEG